MVAGHEWFTSSCCPEGGAGDQAGRDRTAPPKPDAPEVCRQVRDRGLTWNDDQRVRRGQELVL